jgi:hypothetical protein
MVNVTAAVKNHDRGLAGACGVSGSLGLWRRRRKEGKGREERAGTIMAKIPLV